MHVALGAGPGRVLKGKETAGRFSNSCERKFVEAGAGPPLLATLTVVRGKTAKNLQIWTS